MLPEGRCLLRGIFEVAGITHAGINIANVPDDDKKVGARVTCMQFLQISLDFPAPDSFPSLLPFSLQ